MSSGALEGALLSRREKPLMMLSLLAWPWRLHNIWSGLTLWILKDVSIYQGGNVYEKIQF